jgi:hypothetical protein
VKNYTILMIVLVLMVNQWNPLLEWKFVYLTTFLLNI